MFLFQTTQFALQTRQVNVSRINATFRRLSESGDDDNESVDMPEQLSEQVEKSAQQNASKA